MNKRFFKVKIEKAKYKYLILRYQERTNLIQRKVKMRGMKKKSYALKCSCVCQF